MLKKLAFPLLAALSVAACGSSPDPRDSLPYVSQASRIQHYANAFRDVCLRTASQDFKAAENTARSNGFTTDVEVSNVGGLSDGTAIFLISEPTQKKPTGRCWMSVKLASDDAMLREFQRVVQETGFGFGSPRNNRLFGAAYMNTQNRTLVTMGRSEKAGPTNLTVNTGFTIGGA